MIVNLEEIAAKVCPKGICTCLVAPSPGKPDRGTPRMNKSRRREVLIWPQIWPQNGNLPEHAPWC
jgi:hypothetical protein